MDVIPQLPFGSGNAAAANFFRNPDPKCPVMLCTDTSISMDGAKMHALNAGLQTLAQDVSSDALALKRAEFGILSFGPVKVQQNFETMDRCQMPHLTASGDTPMGEAVLKAIDLVEERKRVYKANLVTYYQPIIFLITDGAATDDISAAARAVADGEANKRLTFFAVGVDGADMNALAILSPKRPPVKLNGLAFGPMFQWISQSVKAVARTRPGDGVQLPPTDPWRSM